MVMVKITKLENFSISSKFARKIFTIHTFIIITITAFSARLWKQGNLCACVYQPFEVGEIIDAHLEDWNALNNILWYIDILWYLAFFCYNKKLNRLRVWGLKFCFFKKNKKIANSFKLSVAIFFLWSWGENFKYEMTEWSAFCKISAHSIFSFLKY